MPSTTCPKTTCLPSSQEVLAVQRKNWDDSVEDGPLVAESLLAGAESAEVLRGFGHDVGAELHDDAADPIATSGDVEEHARETHFCFLFCDSGDSGGFFFENFGISVHLQMPVFKANLPM